MTEEAMEMTKAKEEQIIIKNFNLEDMRKPQVRMVSGEATMSPGSLEWITSCRDLPTEFAFELKKLRPSVRNVENAYDPLKQELIERCADRDKEDKLVQKAPNVFSFTARAREFQVEYKKLLDLESELGGKRLEISLKDIPDRLLSADDFASLECIIDFKKKVKENG